MKKIIDISSLHSSVRIVRDAMKHLYVWCALVCIAPFTLIAQDVEDVVLTYSDTYVSPVQNNIKIPILSKQQRSSKLSGQGSNTERQAQLTIISDDVPDTGLASAYEPHVFRIANTSYSVSNPTWKFSLPLADGSTQVNTLADNNLSCRIEAITDETPYKININGDIEGTLMFSCHINGKEVNATPFKVFLELKPLIENAEIVKIVDNSPYASYDAYYKVKYRGADKIKVDVEEEYSSIIKSCYIQEPYIAEGVADHITAPYYAWIDFSAENQYGKSTFTIELQPYGVVSTEYNAEESHRRPHSGIDSGSVAESDECYVIFDIYGNEMSRLTDITDIKDLQYTGFIIILHLKNGSCVETKKMLLR